jgi:DNA helicase IV
MDFLTQEILRQQQSGILFSDIVIGCRLKESLRQVKGSLHKTSIPYYELIDEMGDKHGVHLSTLNSLKGLEYKMVILCDVHEKTAPLDISIFTDMNDVEKEQYLQSERALLYVAFTRAMYKLIITGSGQPSVLVWL